MSTVPTDTTARIRALRDYLSTGLVERGLAVRLSLLAALAGEHLLLIGPPGTAKSLLARRLRLGFADAPYFERLLTRFSVPEELFGPLSIKGLEEDRYQRLTQGYLPTSAIAFLDEIFKANSAILNSLLTLINEREFDNGTVREKTPLIAVIGASNELPEGEELDALFDRFLLRLHVGPVSAQGFRQLAGLSDTTVPPLPEGMALTAADLVEIRENAAQVNVPDTVITMLCELRDWCAAEGLVVSDRRWRKVIKLLRVSAWTNGRDAVSVWDCWLLQHCLWNTPEDREKVYDWCMRWISTDAGESPKRLSRLVAVHKAVLKRAQQQVKRQASKEPKGQREPDNNRTNEGPRLRPRKRNPLEGRPRPLCRNKAPLYLAPALAFTHPKRRRQSVDRTNSGIGYTAQELDSGVWIAKGAFRTPFSKWTQRDPYLADANNRLSHRAPMEFDHLRRAILQSHIGDVEVSLREIADYRDRIGAQSSLLEAEVATDLWVMPEFREAAAAKLARTQRTAATHLERLLKVRKKMQTLLDATDPRGGKQSHAPR